MLRVNHWQKLLRVRFEREPVKRAQKNQEGAQLASAGDAERKGGWEGGVVCEVGVGDVGDAQHMHSQEHGDQKPPRAGKQLRLF